MHMRIHCNCPHARVCCASLMLGIVTHKVDFIFTIIWENFKSKFKFGQLEMTESGNGNGNGNGNGKWKRSSSENTDSHHSR